VPDSRHIFWKYGMLVCFLMMIAAIDFVRMALFITFLPSYLKQLGYTLSTIGLVMSSNLMTDNLSKSGTGWLADHYGPWPVLFGGSLLIVTGVILFKFFHYQWIVMIITAVLIGIGAAPVWPAVVSGTIRIVGEAKRATMISWVSMVWMVGGGLGPVLMGFLIDSGKNGWLKTQLGIKDVYHTGFDILILVAGIGFFMSCLGWMGERLLSSEKLKVSQSETPQKKLKAVLNTLAMVKGLIPGMLIQALSLGVLLPVLLPFITERLGLSESRLSLLLIVGGVFVAGFMVPVGHFADKWGARRFLVSGFLLASLSIIVTAMWATRQNIWFIAAMIGCSYAMIQPAWNALLAGSIPSEQRGVLMGLFMSVEGVGFAIGPLLGGVLGTYRMELPFYISGVLMLVMAVVYVFLPFHSVQDEGRS